MQITSKLLTVAICTIFCLSLCACTDKELTETPVDIQQNTESEDITENNNKQISVNYTLHYYDIVEDKMLDYSGTELFYGSIRPEFFAEKLSELMGMEIAVNSITADGVKMTLDFSSEGVPVCGIGSYGESAVLDSLTQVLLDTFPDISEIYITADGKNYESGHISQPKDTPYATRQENKLG
ncbi:MAG: GerMN domain-containing protein [Clostridia bacterium]|nr:GerMN domain-containing protein [Clostridia bacterium]